MLVSPSAVDSSAAWAAIHAKIPVVIGQPIVAPCFLARRVRMSLIVMTLPRGTRFMMASTSRGEGMTTVPVPQRCDILPSMGTTRGRSGRSASFSRQDLRFGTNLLHMLFGVHSNAAAGAGITHRAVLQHDQFSGVKTLPARGTQRPGSYHEAMVDLLPGQVDGDSYILETANFIVVHVD